MLRHTYIILILLLSSAFDSLSAQTKSGRQESYGIQKNQGQVKDQNANPRKDVLFMGNGGRMSFQIRKKGISYQLYSQESSSIGESDSAIEILSIYRVDINWLNTQGVGHYELSEKNEGYNNYYNVARGMAPALFVEEYRKLITKDIWPGIDLHLAVKEGAIETDWYLEKAESIHQIQMEIKGAELRIEGGFLIMKTPFGEIREGKLKVLQNNIELQANWVLDGNRISFHVEGANPDLPLIVDPPTRIWGSYFGGAGDDRFYASTLDKNENLIACGNVYSTNLATFGAHQTAFVGGSQGLWVGDGIISKFTSNGARMWSTYYGGDRPDDIWNVACDSSNNIYFVGRTLSDTGIATSGSHQSSIGGNGSLQDGFFVKLNSSGIRQWGTYVGGDGSDQAYACAIDKDQNIYISGYAYSNTKIATNGAWQFDVSILGSDAFLMKYKPDGTKLWGTYLGGTGMDQSFSCATDDSGYVYMAGYAESYATMGYNTSHQMTNSGGEDGFLSKFDSSGNMVWSTYFGGVNVDHVTSCVVDANGNIFIAGVTESDSGIAKLGAFQATNAGNGDLFLAKFNGSGELQWGTFFGSSNEEETDIGCLSVDRLGNVYFAGSTGSAWGLSTSGSYQASGAGGKDGILAKFTNTGIRVWSTYFGGNRDENINSLSCGKDDFLFLSGYSTSNTGISTSGSFQSTNMGGADGITAKFRVIESNSISGNQYVCTGQAGANLFGPSYLNAGYTYKWLKSEVDSISGFQAAGGNDTSSTYSPGLITKNTWLKRVLSQYGVHDTSNVLLASPATNPIALAQVIDDSLCFGDTLFVFNQSNFMGDVSKRVNWYYSDTLIGVDDTLAFVPHVSGNDSLQFIIESASGCLDTTHVYFNQVKVGNRIVMEMDSGALCPGETRTLYTSTDIGMSTTWFFNGSNVKQGMDSFFVANDSGTYWVTVVSQEGCSAGSDTLQLDFAELPQLKLNTNFDTLCQNDWLRITDTTQGGPSFNRKWWLQGQLYDSLKSIEIQLVDSGIHWFVLKTETNDACMVSDSISAFVKANPFINGLNGTRSNVRIDSAYVYLAQTLSAQTFTWSVKEGSLISGQGSNQISVKWNDTTQGGLYLLVKAANGCSDSADYAVSMDLIPVIYQFSPQQGKQGDTIFIEGVNFSRTNLVSVGGVLVQSYEIADSRHVTAVLGTGDDGNVRIETPYGTAELGAFNFQGVFVRDIENGQIRIYPNPVQNLLNIEITGNQNSSEYKLYSAEGKVLMSGIHQGGTIELNLSELAAGLYFLAIDGQKFLVEKL